MTEQLDRAVAGRLPLEQRRAVESPFDRESDLANVLGLAGLDGRFDLVHGASAEGPTHLTVRHQQVLQYAFDVHGYHLPDAPPPPKPPPPPLKPPP